MGGSVGGHPWPVPAFSCELEFDLQVPSVLALRIAAADPTTEQLDVSAPVREIGERIHLVDAPAGRLTVAYSGEAAPIAPTPITDDDVVRYLRQSRYCPSDAMEGFARKTFGDGADPFDVATWVFDRLSNESGSSDSLDTAIETLLTGKGVCRDYAHLVVALCRGIGRPARVVAAYAPGLEPMDFHAVAEVAVDGTWRVHDATRLAPPETFVRICHGRDAADVAFASTIRGDAPLVRSSVTATA